MKKILLSITNKNNNITYSMGHDKNDETSIIVSIDKPYGVTASSADITTIFSDMYTHINGTASATTKVNANITELLLKEDRVSTTIKYLKD